MKFEQSFNKSFRANPLQPIHSDSPLWTLTQPSIDWILHKIPTTNKSTYLRHISKLLKDYLLHTICLTVGSKTINRTACAYSIDGVIIAHCVRNKASIFTANSRSSSPVYLNSLNARLTLSTFSSQIHCLHLAWSPIHLLPIYSPKESTSHSLL